MTYTVKEHLSQFHSYSHSVMNSSSWHIFITPLCPCFRFSPVSAPVLSLVSCLTVFTWAVFGSWLVYLSDMLCVCVLSMKGLSNNISYYQVIVSAFYYSSLCFWPVPVYFFMNMVACWWWEHKDQHVACGRFLCSISLLKSIAHPSCLQRQWLLR